MRPYHDPPEVRYVPFSGSVFALNIALNNFSLGQLVVISHAKVAFSSMYILKFVSVYYLWKHEYIYVLFCSVNGRLIG